MDDRYPELSRLRTELGHNTTILRELVGELSAGIDDLRARETETNEGMASAVHQLAGTAALLTPRDTLLRLNQLEKSFIRKDADARTSCIAMCDDLEKLAAEFEVWVNNAPPDGVPIGG